MATRLSILDNRVQNTANEKQLKCDNVAAFPISLEIIEILSKMDLARTEKKRQNRARYLKRIEHSKLRK